MDSMDSFGNPDRPTTAAEARRFQDFLTHCRALFPSCAKVSDQELKQLAGAMLQTRIAYETGTQAAWQEAMHEAARLTLKVRALEAAGGKVAAEKAVDMLVGRVPAVESFLQQCRARAQRDAFYDTALGKSYEPAATVACPDCLATPGFYVGLTMKEPCQRCQGSAKVPHVPPTREDRVHRVTGRSTHSG